MATGTAEQLERQFAKEFGRLSTKHRQELDRLLGDPPNARNVPPGFWAKVKQEAESELAAYLLLVYLAASDDIEVSGDIEGRVFSGQRAARIADGYVRHSQKRLDVLTNRWSTVLDRGGVVTRGDVLDGTVAIFGPTRAARMATHEGVTARNKAVSDGLGVRRLRSDTLVTLGWYLDPGCNHCVFCPKIHKTPKEFWGQFIEAPPAHIGCCCKVMIANYDSLLDESSWPSVDEVIAAAQEAGIFGFA